MQLWVREKFRLRFTYQLLDIKYFWEHLENFQYEIMVKQSQLSNSLSNVTGVGFILLQITFFEDKTFEGRSYEVTTDQPDLCAHLNCCNSVKVESGCYEHPNYGGHQYFLKKGEYPDYQQWMGSSDSIRSCLDLPSQPQKHSQLQIYDKNDFGGRMLEFMDDCSSLQEDFHYSNIQSCHVLEGSWIFYEKPHFRGQQYLLKPGEYRQFTDWGATTAKVGSFQPTVDIS
ncbi:gamma-crystallin B-like [Apteryx mantelli]|uniref:Gamma-crystallin B-like n=1 Tax=Apteryx mantelli TaxID=2696672 RepID=A0ABM4EPU5_9AVES